MSCKLLEALCACYWCVYRSDPSSKKLNHNLDNHSVLGNAHTHYVSLDPLETNVLWHWSHCCWSVGWGASDTFSQLCQNILLVLWLLRMWSRYMSLSKNIVLQPTHHIPSSKIPLCQFFSFSSHFSLFRKWAIMSALKSPGSLQVGSSCSSLDTPLLVGFLVVSRRKKLQWGITWTILWQNLQPWWRQAWKLTWSLKCFLQSSQPHDWPALHLKCFLSHNIHGQGMVHLPRLQPYMMVRLSKLVAGPRSSCTLTCRIGRSWTSSWDAAAPGLMMYS